MWNLIWKYVHPHWGSVVKIALIIVVMAGLSQVEPFITKQITDGLVDRTTEISFRQIGLLLAVLLTIRIVQAVLNRISWYLTNVFRWRFESDLIQTGFDHLMKLSLSFFHEQETGKVMSKLDRGVNRLVSIVNNSGMHFLPSLTTALVSFAIVLYYEWRIGVLTVLAFAPYVWISHWRFKRNNKLERHEYKLYDQHYSHFYEVINSMELVKAFRAENYERRRLARFFRQVMDIRLEMEQNTNRAFSGDLILEALSWSMYAYIVWMTWQGQITVGTLILLVGLIQLIRQPLWQINWIFWEVKRAQIGARDFFRIMEVQPEVIDPVHPIELERIEGRIEFKHVWFSYRKDLKEHFDRILDEEETPVVQPIVKTKPAETVKKNDGVGKKIRVLKNVSFTLEPNQVTAFVGPSGAGKTTVASLLMRFFDPNQGAILLDGIDVRQLSQRELRAHIGLVSQDAILFADTIEQNLRYGKPDATEVEMWNAARIARADVFINDLPDGLKTSIGERGVKLSGGQRQRLSLARTILRDPQIIILDEATSALDSESEMYIQQALKDVLKGRTAVVIAHRLSTVQRADKIIVLRDNQVLEQGSHLELMAKDGLYASLFKIQSGDIEKLKEWDLVQ